MVSRRENQELRSFFSDPRSIPSQNELSGEKPQAVTFLIEGSERRVKLWPQFFESRGCLICLTTVLSAARSFSGNVSFVMLHHQPWWRNWQTRMIQVHVSVKDVEVRLLSRAF